MRRFFHPVVPVIVAVFYAGALSPAFAADFDSYEVDLAAQAFARALPFDIEFFVTGKTPDLARFVSLRVVQTSPIPNLKNPKEAPLEVCTEPPTPAAGRCIRRWEAATAKNATMFRILVPPLEANRTYRFEFEFRSGATPEETTTFQVAARVALEPELFNIMPDANGELTSADSLKLRKILSSRLDQLLPPERVLKEGTLFDLNLPATSQVLNAFNVAVQEILGPNANLVQLHGSYATGQARLAIALRAVLAEGGADALSRLAVRLRDTNVPAVRTLLETFGNGLTLATLDDAAVSARAAGAQPVAAPSAPFATVLSAAEVAPYAANFERTRTDAEALRRLLDALIGTTNQTLLPKETNLSDRAILARIAAVDGDLATARETAAALAATAGRAQQSLATRDRAIASLMAVVVVEHRKLIITDATTNADGATASSWYVGADAGIAYAFRIGVLTPYVGANIYFRPVNKAASLREADSFGRRFSMTVGITLRSIEESSEGSLTAAQKTRTGILDDNGRTLMLGAGLRVTRSLRLSGGAMFVKERNPNPLISRHSVTTVPYVSFSLDTDLVGALQGDVKSFLGSGSGGGGNGSNSSRAN